MTWNSNSNISFEVLMAIFFLKYSFPPSSLEFAGIPELGV